MKTLACYPWTRVPITGPVVGLIIGCLDQGQSTVGPKRTNYLAGMNKDLNARANLSKSWHQTVKEIIF